MTPDLTIAGMHASMDGFETLWLVIGFGLMAWDYVSDVLEWWK